MTRHAPAQAAKLYARHSDKNQAPPTATEIIELARRVHTGEVSFSEWSVFVRDQCFPLTPVRHCRGRFRAAIFTYGEGNTV